MRELKILAVVVVFTLITYWGVEPFAHSQMHPHVEPADYEFKDVDGLNGLQGNATNGAALVQANCTACHSIEKEGFPPVMDDATSAASYGVVPPDLSTAGKIYNADYLAAFIKDPAKASKVEHKFKDGRIHPMPGYSWMKPQEIADMVAYLQSIAPEKMSNKEVFVDACQRCHGIKYGDMKGGTMAAKTPNENIKAYMGKLPPDLSQYIRSRGESYLHTFVNDPQKHLEGTAMPRVGLTQDAEQQVIDYMEQVGDSKKAEREALGPKFLIYLVILAIFAWLWKAKIWRELH
ncbi:cytochrome C [Malaciobacter halophilus]|uniref:Cytochrome C n=1 Tax=Malaciobacter halophilus TaxID=197482 RepID=A0A2N1J3Z4_9BACT|nr:c-type cytochrome [Malaciobacter halophilus]AXH08740.1 ubiquinol cytochrome c oxidoreductase PetABC, membrane-bound cytochrome c subunit [Malaciobacter halophilus]PKI81266.1 cytochrome C [Malaciobacter halophilus]